jgi:mannose-6-phosphate isomerase
MSKSVFGLLRFDEAYFDRIWGGTRLSTLLDKPVPEGRTIGEAWLLSDHEEHESRVMAGKFSGKTLQNLLAIDELALLGARARRTVHGRFPLLLKLLDSAQTLSVQVHPNDADAARLGEPDVGKTEMWHVIDAAPDAELICGLRNGVTRGELARSIANGAMEELMVSFPSPAGTSAFIPAGTVHAIGGGILLAEIQQNSNITYRLYDWGRVDQNGKPRALHVEKALEVTHFTAMNPGAAEPLSYLRGDTRCEILSACRYFLSELLHIETPFERHFEKESFHLLLLISGKMTVESSGEQVELRPGEAVLVPADSYGYGARGTGKLLDYSVPDITQDIVTPLLAAGHAPDRIARLGGYTRLEDFIAQS